VAVIDLGWCQKGQFTLDTDNQPHPFLRADRNWGDERMRVRAEEVKYRSERKERLGESGLN